MAHNEHFEQLAALQALGIPLGGEAAEFARHLEGCAECDALLRDLSAASTAFAAGVRPAPPRPAVRQAILDAVAASSVRSFPGAAGSSKPRYGAWILAIAASVLLAFFVADDAKLRREREELRSRTADLSSRLDS